ncbi:MAG: helix-turn-helix domain-containing protein [bacterium]|nr:helix-turn-helix domain-containing protein [Acidimicrobiia bacterium]MCY4649305.1 helix-turn-helix domain-containing protein [bacterium]
MAARLVFEERCAIEAMIEVKVSTQQTADALDRHPSTVRREINRGCGRDAYRAEDAQAEAEVRGRRPKIPKLVTDPQLADAVSEGLKMGWSPHAIAADLRNECLDSDRRVCAETIYQACYEPWGRRGLTAGPP